LATARRTGELRRKRMNVLANIFVSIGRDERGQDLIEYALLAGFVAVAVGATFPPIGNLIASMFSRVGSVLDLTP
jgi:pilus assembly protein Flp/PilA